MGIAHVNIIFFYKGNMDMIKYIYLIKECDEIIDICETQEQVVKSVNFWVKKRQEEFGMNESEVRENIIFIEYRINRYLKESTKI